MVRAMTPYYVLATTITFVATVSAIPARAINARQDKPDKDGRTALNFATIGDSWASGVTYGLLGSTNYDDNKSGCMRLNHAYGAQLKDGLKEDTEALKTGTFTFAACSGARLVGMAKGQRQLDQAQKDTHFVTMQAGGNDVGFYNVASNCIYHNDYSKDYGAEYPEPGACSSAIQDAQDVIDAGSDQIGIWKWMDDTINDVLIHPNAQRDNFKLYVLGYAHLFNDAPESSWCNDKSFTVNPKELLPDKAPFSRSSVKLTQALRTRINDLTTRMNDQIQDVVKYHNTPKVVYVSVTEGFEGHRFCEGGSNWFDQYFGDDSWFWNASPADVFNLGDKEVDGATYANTLLEQAKVNNEWSAVYNTSAPSEAALNAYNWQDLLATTKGLTALSPHQGLSSGVALRPLHPKMNGHTTISQILTKQVNDDFTVGCEPACPWSPASSPP